MSNLMQGAGFADTDVGPFVTELRRTMETKEAAGLRFMSPGTWAAGPFWVVDAEVRAREMLAIEWSMKRGHEYRVECLDPPISWRFNARTRKRRLEVRWQSLPAWFGDRFRECGMHYRIWRDRKLVNPYRRPK